MLRYTETNWLYEEGFQTHDYQITFEQFKSQNTMEEQKKRAERLSLVMLFNDNESNRFFEISRRFQKNNEHFYFDKNKKLHATMLGFPVIDSAYYESVGKILSNSLKGCKQK